MANEEKAVQPEIKAVEEPKAAPVVAEQPPQATPVAKPVVKPAPRKIHLADFLNETYEIKSGKIEVLGAFGYYMEHVKKIMKATEDEFRAELEKFKKLPV